MTAVMTAGFVAVFGLVGLAVTQLSSSILDHAKWATIVVGLGLVGLGIALLAGQGADRPPPPPRPGRHTAGSCASMLLFGISYAVASLSCTLPAVPGHHLVDLQPLRHARRAGHVHRLRAGHGR